MRAVCRGIYSAHTSTHTSGRMYVLRASQLFSYLCLFRRKAIARQPEKYRLLALLSTAEICLMSLRL